MISSENSFPAIHVQSLKKTFGDFIAVDDVSFSVPKGTILGLLGPNGAGKTTIVRMLTTLAKADRGNMTVAGFDVTQQSDEVRKRIGVAGQSAAVDEHLTAVENLDMIARLHRMSSQDSKRKGRELIELFNLQEAMDRPLKTYSGGMRRRLDLAASLVSDPEVIFLDEPTTGLDPKSRLDLWRILENLVANGTTILLTTQYLEEADYLADQIVMIDHGKIVAQGTTDELKAQRGGDVLEIHAEDASLAPELARILADVGSSAPTLGEDGLVTIPVTHSTKSLFDAVRRLDAANIAVADLALRRPTLDEVFLHLTDNRA